ncbi:MAG: type I-MYXAN CRISPR-associated protein Cas5/Cmx5/DevS [Cyanobacteriota bacterium]|nr:type I-MYXAN CRISPR-associated protein Cas5/Cmx5/DevS [Cyanobacteriota bacterium]
MATLTEFLALQVDVPIACFRQSRAREYAQTYPVPPPSTVYGMLLSAVGETNRYRHCGVKLAIALLSTPEKSTIIRTFRRFKKKEIHHPANARPDYQELLANIQFVVWVDGGSDRAHPSLPQRLHRAMENPAEIARFGGLSLGESRDLVNELTLLSNPDIQTPLSWLIQDEDGLLTLPYWVDYIGSQGTRWRRYSQETAQNREIPPLAWTTIESA